MKLSWVPRMLPIDVSITNDQVQIEVLTAGTAWPSPGIDIVVIVGGPGGRSWSFIVADNKDDRRLQPCWSKRLC
jgi:hypothetical protein